MFESCSLFVQPSICRGMNVILLNLCSNLNIIYAFITLYSSTSLSLKKKLETRRSSIKYSRNLNQGDEVQMFYFWTYT